MSENSIAERLGSLHGQLQQYCHGLQRIAVALYDRKSDSLRTFIDSTDLQNPLKHYMTPLSDVPSLRLLAETGRNRVIDDLSALQGSRKEHTRKILDAGFNSSFTVPMFSHNKFIGFIFFDSDEKSYFTDAIQVHLSVYSQLVTAIIANDITPIKTLKGAVKTAREFTRFRDEETAAHLSRMSHYARLIAIELADSCDIDEEKIEFIFQFTPLHDLGKVAIPDHILLKTGPLSPAERKTMRSHVERGIEIIDVMVNEFELDSIHHISILRNIIASHHECFDGSGYPLGLKGKAIPLEGRITAAADVFDALLSARPYKKAWPWEKTIDYMLENAGKKFDPQCVHAIESNLDKIRTIHDQFKDESF